MDDTPRSVLFDDVYFSALDGVGETNHVFLDGNNLPHAWQGRPRFTIGETGFGTGLNFLLAWELFDRTADKGAFLDFVSVEKFPLSADEIRQGLGPWAARLNPYLDKLVAAYPIRVPGFHRVVFDGRVALTLVFGDANDVMPEIEADVDAWFLDGFTPSKNPDMWTDKVFGEMARMSHEGTSFATFTAAGFVKRGLRAAGFTVEKKRGFGPKRDMLAGHYNGTEKPAVPYKTITSVAIMGAGLAGTSCAHVLRQYGFSPSLYDPNGIASGASGNPVGLINPRFTAFRSEESDFYTAAFAQTVRTFPKLDASYLRCGSLHLITDEDREKRLSRTVQNWGWHEDHMRYVDAEEASRLAGVKLAHAALYLTDSAQINPSALCRAYAGDLPVIQEDAIPPSDAVILANGAAAANHPALAGLPVHTVRGQITFAKANDVTQSLKANLNYGGYICASLNGIHAVGSTFQKWLDDLAPRAEDDDSNLQNLESVLPAAAGLVSCGNRAGLRAAAKDRFPVIGAVSGADNLYVTSAHGSHGIVSTLAGAHLLADFLRGGPYSLGRSTINALSPARFAERQRGKE